MAAVDYYGVLDLQRTCSVLDVKMAYRRVALSLHPDRARLQPPLLLGPQGVAERRQDGDGEARRFALAARAYEVLVDPRTRAAYDLRGEACLPKFHGDPHLTFRRFFGTENPFFAQLRDRSHFHLEEPKSPETLVLPLAVSLEEINSGVTKTCKASVRVAAGGDCTSLAERDFTVLVLPGAASGTTYTFRGQGHQRPGQPPGDVVLVLEELPHREYQRDGANLVREVEVPLRDCLMLATGAATFSVEIHTLDGRLLRMAVTDCIRPGLEKSLVGEGLPRAGEPNGDLLLRFSVQFPSTLADLKQIYLDVMAQSAGGGHIKQ